MLLVPLAGGGEAAPRLATPQQAEFFESKVRPILVENCWSCHGAKKQMAGLRLDSFASFMRGQ
jgi:hypothetical protein